MQTAPAEETSPLPRNIFGSVRALVLCPSSSPKSQPDKMVIASKQSQGGLRQGGRHTGRGLEGGGNPGSKGGCGVASDAP